MILETLKSRCGAPRANAGSTICRPKCFEVGTQRWGLTIRVLS